MIAIRYPLRDNPPPSHRLFIPSPIVKKHVLPYPMIERRKEITEGGANMTMTRDERVEFNPQKGLLGWMVERNRRPRR